VQLSALTTVGEHPARRQPAVGRGRRLLVGIFVLGAAGVSPTARAEPFVPPHDQQVLEQVPAGGHFSARTGHGRIDDALPDAIARAQTYIRLSRRTGDPRFAGRAEALLAPWWRQRRAPAEALLVRALIRQHRHEFAAALRDLDTVLALEPRNPQALLTRATIHQVTGDYDAARSSCLRLLGAASDLTAVTCVASVSSLSGRAEAAFETLNQALQDHPRSRAEERQWALGVLADIAVRMGRHGQAERLFARALSAAPPDVYLLTRYADFLLERRRFDEVLARLQGYGSVDALALRRTRALHQLGLPGAGSETRALTRRLEQMQRRGDSHPGFQARAHLYILEQPADALHFALRNWATQREPEDTQLVLEAALAAGQPRAARPVLEWLDRSGLEDVRLDSLRRRLRAS
jgi:Tfp pilus assembly protein PilF